MSMNTIYVLEDYMTKEELEQHSKTMCKIYSAILITTGIVFLFSLL